MSDQLSFLSEDAPVNPSRSPDSEKDWLTRVATSRSTFLKFLMQNGPAGWYTKTSPASFQAYPTMHPIHVRRHHQWIWSSTDKKWNLKTTTIQKNFTHSDAFWPDYQNSGTGGRMSFSTLNISEFRNGAVASSLSDILESWESPLTRSQFKSRKSFQKYLLRYYLTALACRGILRRAERRGKDLPPTLQAALESVAMGLTSQKSPTPSDPGPQTNPPTAS